MTKGKVHDFKMFKNSKVLIHPTTTLLADSGYQEMVKIHSNSQIPDLELASTVEINALANSAQFTVLTLSKASNIPAKNSLLALLLFNSYRADFFVPIGDDLLFLS